MRLTHATLQVALVYPNVYRVGMGNLGFQTVYSLLNDLPETSAERFFLPDTGVEGTVGIGEPKSEESARPLSAFPVIAFSIPYENDYPMVPGMLIAAGLSPLARDRKPGDPLVVAGGVAVSLNPEPLAPFVDVVFVGEARDGSEGAAARLFTRLEEILRFIGSGSTGPRSAGAADWAGELRDIPGVYVPARYSAEYTEDGRLGRMSPGDGFPDRVRAVKHLSKTGPAPVSVLSSPDAEFGESLLVEVNRGCGRGCRFCAAGWIHLPVRHVAYYRVQRDVDAAIAAGRTVGVIGADLAGHPQLEELLTDIVDRGGTFSLSSIRPEGLTPTVIRLLAATGQKTATLAPEVASPRMKRIVGKEIPSERFYDLVGQLVSEGIPNIRFYFMIGLPGEIDEDVEAVVDFVQEARRQFVAASRPRRSIGRLSIQVNPFVPKPWTPFQWSAAAELRELRRRMDIVARGLRGLPNVKVRGESPRQALAQALFARGDRRIADEILRAARSGGSWWRELSRSTMLLESHVYRSRLPEELLPWDVVDHGVSKEALWRSFNRATAEAPPVR